MSFSIAGKTAIVTGAAHGLGLAIARHFVDQGANVVFADRDEAQLMRELAEDAKDAPHISIFAGDLREKLAVANLISTTVDAYERIDILVNAARQVAVTDPLAAADKSFDLMIDQNLKLPFRLSQAVARRMIGQEANAAGHKGCIVNLGTVAATAGHGDLLGYSVAGAGLNQLTRALALSLAGEGVRVNALAIGSVMTASLKAAIKDHEDYRHEIMTHTPMGRIAGPEEVVEAVQFLASDAASFLTGQVLTADGGRGLADPTGIAAH